MDYGHNPLTIYTPDVNTLQVCTIIYMGITLVLVNTNYGPKIHIRPPPSNKPLIYGRIQ